MHHAVHAANVLYALSLQKISLYRGYPRLSFFLWGGGPGGVLPATVLSVLSLQDIQCGDNPSVFKSLQTHGDDVSTFSLRDDHAGFDDRC